MALSITALPSHSGSKLFLSEMPGKSALVARARVANKDLFNITVAADIDEMEKLNLDTIVVLLSKREMRELYPVDSLLDRYRKELKTVNIVYYPIEDRSTPDDVKSFDALITSILVKLNQKKNVLVHCAAGLGRTGTVASAVLIKTGIAPKRALAHIRSLRPGSVETPSQMRFLDEYNIMKSS